MYMALIQCPECGKRFSEHAPACPDCGMPTELIERQSAGAAEQTAAPPPEAHAEEATPKEAAPEAAEPVRENRQSFRLQPNNPSPARPAGGSGELRLTQPTPRQEQRTPPSPWQRNGQNAVRPSAPATPRPATAAPRPAATATPRPQPVRPYGEPIRPVAVSTQSAKTSSGGAVFGVLALVFALLTGLALFADKLFGAGVTRYAAYLNLAALLLGIVGVVFLTLAFAKSGNKALPAISCVLLAACLVGFVLVKNPLGLAGDANPFPVPTPAGQTSGLTAQTQPTAAEEPEPATPADAVELRIGETLSTDFMELTLDAFEISEGYTFSYKEGNVTHKTGIDCPGGMKLLTLRGRFTNLLNKEVSVMSNGPIKGMIIVNGSEYTTKMRCLNAAEADNLWNVASKQTVDCFITAEVPEAMASEVGACTIRLACNDNMDEGRWVSDFNEYPYQFTVEAEPTKTLEELAAEEPERLLPLSLNTTVSTPEYDFTIDTVEFTYELKPRNTSRMYSSYPAESGKIYLHVQGSFYNSSRRDLRLSDLPVAKVNYNDGYYYEGFALVPDGDNRFDWVSTYVVCTPLNSCQYHCLVELPESVAQSDAPLFFTMQLGGDVYRYDVR